MPATGAGYTLTVVSVAGEFFHERREPTWRRAIDIAHDLRFEFPCRVIVISDGTHIWSLDELET